MSRQLDQTISDAAAKNFSLAARPGVAGRSGTGIAQPPLHRAPFPPLPPACTALHRQLPVQPPQEPHGAEEPHPPPARSGLPGQRHQRRHHRQSRRRARPSWRKSSAGAPARPISACCSPPPWTCSITCWPRRSITRSSASSGSIPNPLCSSVDELGYLSLDQQTSNLFYQVISTRHSHKRTTVITTNTAFSDWGNILYNTTIATAIADRLVENSEIFLLGGDSLRKANQKIRIRRRNSPPAPSRRRAVRYPDTEESAG